METVKTLLPVVYEQNEATLTAAVEQSRGLRIEGPEDRKGYAAVHAARVRLKSYRTAIEAQRKELKASAIEYGRRVDAEAKRLTAIVEPTELELEAEQKRIDAERERIKAEAEAARKAKLDGRVAAFLALGVQVAPSAVEALSDEEYESSLEIARVEWAARQERERLEAEARAAEEAAARAAIEAQRRADEEARRAERERLAAERAELERQRQQIEAERERALAEVRRQEAIQRAEYEEQRAAQAKLDAERKALEAERAAIEAAKAKPAPAAEPEPESPPLFPEISEAGPVDVAEAIAECGAEDEAEALAAAAEWIWNEPTAREIAIREEMDVCEDWDEASFACGYLAGMRAERARKAEGS